MAGFDHNYARRMLEQHRGSNELSADDEELLKRFERARTDPTFTDDERKQLEADLKAHPVLGAPVITWYPDL